MLWKLPPKVKVLEALGCIADSRIKVINENTARIKSSNLDKEYTVRLYLDKKKVYSDDNASKFKHYIGYPIIAFLLFKGIIKQDKETKKLIPLLKGIKWHDLNDKFKRDYDKTMNYVIELCEKKGFSRQEVMSIIDRIMKELKELKPKY